MTLIASSAILRVSIGAEGRLLRNSACVRRRWLGTIPGVAAASVVVMLSWASLCLCSEGRVLVQPFFGGCGLVAWEHLEAAQVVPLDEEGDECLGPCVDVRTLRASAPGKDGASVPAAVLVSMPWRPASDGIRGPSLLLGPPAGRLPSGRLSYTILRC